MRPVRAALKAYAVSSPPDSARAAADVAEARRVVEGSAELAADQRGTTLFGPTWPTPHATPDDWLAVETTLRFADRARRHLAEASDRLRAAGIVEAVQRRVITPDETKAPPAIAEEVRRADTAAAELTRLLAADLDDAAPFADRSASLQRWRGALSDLPDWCAWRAQRAEAERAGLGALVRALEADTLSPAEAPATFERSFAQRWLPATADRLDRIRGFSGRGHNQAIRRFAEVDSAFLALSRELIRADLAAAVPRPSTNPSPNSEMGVLLRQLELKRRHLPIRKLIERISATLARLKPCFLMSPLSIAQYLDPALPPFDLVVFDEASQIPPWEAIGAIARGSRVVVVGDSKQLPPTSFFEKTEPEDDDTATEAEELESILQECIAAGLPARRLLWHYRSRHDSLIAFSNEHYYDNTLRTFPAPAEPGEDLGVTFRRVDGVYDRGSTRTNRIEADAVVDELARLVKRGTRTVGVVCFNLAQQVLIEDLFDERCRTDRELDAARERDAATLEPAFIKNLESVQGDERDIILFSVTYGPDAERRMTVNFGPLNRDGGERRLNVAITRARRRVTAFASFDPAQLDPARTEAIGVRHLRRFLEYAERASHPDAPPTTRSATPLELDAISAAVRDELRARGHDIAEHVGTGPSRIELAVRHLDEPSRYVLGIEFDGDTYADPRTARDRDRLRSSVMAGLGWTLHRVWAVEWHLNREGVLKSLERAITDARRAAQRADADPADTPADVDVPAPSVPDDQTTIANPTATPTATPAPRAPETTNTYQAWRPDTIVGDRETLLNADAAVTDVLVESVRVEAPIVPELAARRAATAFGVDRFTRAIRERCEAIIDKAVTRGRIQRVDDALWPKRTEPTIQDPREPGEGPDDRRSLDEITLAERVAAVRRALAEQVALPEEDLARAAARILGTQRLAERTRELIQDAIDAAVESGIATRDDDQVTAVRTDD